MNKNINFSEGKKWDFSTPKVLGILNLTPDSFYDGGKYKSEDEIISQAQRMIDEGADGLDLGAYSTRPNAADISIEEEWSRLQPILPLLRKLFPTTVLSVDTFRSEVAAKAIQEGADLINDVSGGGIDSKMFDVINEAQIPYVLMHMRGTPQTMQTLTNYEDFWEEIHAYFDLKLAQLKNRNQVIIDPGFGFAKTLEQNFHLLKNIKKLEIFDCPILVGVSRKSMIYKTLNINSQNALNGTTVLNTYALTQGASILRVHDVKEAKECVSLCKYL